VRTAIATTAKIGSLVCFLYRLRERIEMSASRAQFAYACRRHGLSAVVRDRAAAAGSQRSRRTTQPCCIELSVGDACTEPVEGLLARIYETLPLV